MAQYIAVNRFSSCARSEKSLITDTSTLVWQQKVKIHAEHCYYIYVIKLEWLHIEAVYHKVEDGMLRFVTR